MVRQRKRFYEFGPYRIDTEERQLLHSGDPVPLPPKVYDTLLTLVTHSGRIVEKEELMKAVWPDTFVEDANVTVNISALRKVLGEGEAYIETVPRRGYRFASPVTQVEDGSDDLFIDERKENQAVSPSHATVTANDKGVEPPERASRLSRNRSVRMAVVGLAVLLVGLIATAYYIRAKRAESGLSVRSIAVLPFKPLVPEARDEPLEMGMCDALIMRLGGLNQLVVRPTSSVVRYNKLGQDPLAAGRELGVDALLDGYVQRSGDRIRVTAQLLSVADGRHLWSGQFNENFTDIFAVEDSISRQMVDALLLKLTGEERGRVTRHYTENVDAYELYLKGRYFLEKRTPDGVNKSIDYFQQASEKDSQYALAFAALAEAYVILAVRADMPPKESSQKAKTAAMRALEIDDTNAEAHYALGHVRCWFDWDWSGAELEFKRGIQLSLNNPTATQYYASYLIAVGRHQEAVSEIKRAQRLAPLSLNINVQVARILFFAREYDDSIEQCRKTLEIESNYGGARLFLGRVYTQKGMYREALAELEKARELLGDGGAEVLSLIGYTYAVSGRRVEGLKILQELQIQSEQRYVSPYHMAMVYAGLGEQDKAFIWLEKAFEDREGRMTLLKFVPEFDRLRTDSRYADLIRRIGLPHERG